MKISRRLTLLLFIIALVVILLAAYFLISSYPNFTFDLKNSRIIIESQNSDTDLDITSGGALIIENGYATTLTGETTPSDIWYIKNQRNNDLVKQKYPQIVFRAITPKASINWSNYKVTLELIPSKNFKSDSPEVDGTDGIYLFLYYHDQDNLYVGGISKDGRIIIKRKSDSFYGLIAERYIFKGSYNPNDNLINPFIEAKIILTATIKNKANNEVEITIDVQIFDKNGDLKVSQSIIGIDDGRLISQDDIQILFGNPTNSGKAGIRLDSIEAKILKFHVEPNKE